MIRPSAILYTKPSGKSPFWLGISPAFLLPIAIVGPNAALVVYAIAVLTIGLRVLWRPGEPPILLFIFLYQWLQSAIGVIYGNVRNVPLSEAAYFAGRHELASGLMLSGVLVLALAMRAAAGKPDLKLQYELKGLFNERQFSFWVKIYAVAWLISAVCQVIAPLVAGLQQPLTTMSGTKWAAFVLLTAAAFHGSNSSARNIWASIFAFEFLLSIGGFFASFKEVFFFALFGIAAAGHRLSHRLVISGAVMAVIMLALALVWTAIKSDYRAFANAGTGQQVVLIDYEERLTKLGSLVGQIDSKALQDATDDFIKRIMYHNYFGAAAANVPSRIPHSDGEIWGEAISRPFMPRMLFPDKRSIDDSDLTNQYTGLNVALADQGTSISIGYMGEAYIDFGPILMFAPIAAFGGGIGLFYRWLMGQPGRLVVIGAALSPFALMPAHLAESSILKVIPWLILTLLACIVTIRIFALSRFERSARITTSRLRASRALRIRRRSL
jgi:hypothetical protein